MKRVNRLNVLRLIKKHFAWKRQNTLETFTTNRFRGPFYNTIHNILMKKMV